MNRRLAYAAALFVIVGWTCISPLRALAQLLPPLPPPPSTGSLVVSMTSPASGDTVRGTVPVSASVSIVGSLTVAGVQFKLDGANLGAEDTSAPYSVSWNTTTTSNGSHTLKAVARDILGVSWNSNTITVTVSNDTTRPSVTINQAAGQPDPTNTSPITFTAVFSEPVSGFTGADVTVTGTAGGTKTVAVTGGPSTYTVAVSGMTSSGTVIATIPAGVAKDAADNANTASTSTDNQVVFDATAPAPPSTPDLAAASDSGFSTDNLTNDNSPTFTGTAEAGSTVKIFSDGIQVGSGTTTGGSYSITTSPLSDGVHSITATATDAAKNVSTSSGALSVTIDTTPPTVAMTSPASGSTVSGTITVSADASDNVGVFEVVFFLVGAPRTIGEEVTTAPYSVVWHTDTETNGSHTLAAVARDTAGNQTTSAPVTVTVSNESARPTVAINQAAGQADPTSTAPITFTAVFSEPVSGFTGADVTITGTAGGTKTVAVTGGASTYTVAVSGMTSGGTVLATVAAGVAQDAAGNTNTASTSTDNTVTFTTTTDTVTRFEEDNAAISYSPAGAWVQRGPEIAAFSGGIAVSSDVAGATATFTFTGTAVSWIGLKCSVCGIASVSIDGGAETSVDTAGAAAPGSSGLTSEVVFTASGLADESHTMVITVTGTTSSADAHIIVDAFDVTGTGGGAPPTVTRIEETDPAVSYTGNWFQVCDPRASGGCGEESIEVGAQATLSFTGTGVRWIGWRNEGGGIANVYVDGILKGDVDTYSPTTEPQAEVFTASGLPGGPHTLTIEVTGRGRNPATGTWIIIDAFDVTP